MNKVEMDTAVESLLHEEHFSFEMARYILRIEGISRTIRRIHFMCKNNRSWVFLNDRIVSDPEVIALALQTAHERQMRQQLLLPPEVE